MKPSRFFKRDTRRHTFAQAMLEFALVLPIILVVLVGIIEYSRLFYAWLIVENSTRFGVRLASTGEYNPIYCVLLSRICSMQNLFCLKQMLKDG